MKTALCLLSALYLLTAKAAAQTDKEIKYRTIYSQGFSSDKSTEDFEFSDAGKWLVSKNGKPGKTLKCLGKGAYSSTHDGPSIIAILKHYELSDFILEMDIQQNGKDYGLLDFCIFFGIKDTTHYCYAQIAAQADKNTHNLFKVLGEKPKRIGQVHNEGVIWGIDKWHHVKIERNQETNTVKVYFNEELVMEAKDDAMTSGLIGFGSTNSALKVDNVKLTAPEYKETKISVFN